MMMIIIVVIVIIIVVIIVIIVVRACLPHMSNTRNIVLKNWSLK